MITGEALAAALAGVECVIDAASGPSPEQQLATEFFTTAARNLHDFGERAHVRRIVVVSIIGCDRFTAGYNAAKAAHERAMLAGPIPVQILRAAQFHEFVAQLVDWGRRGEVSYVPKMRTQLVAARTVAEALADLATGPGTTPAPGSAGAPIPEIAGPQEESLVDMAVLLTARRGDPVKIEGVTYSADPTTTSTRTVRCYPARTPPSPARRSGSGSTPHPEPPWPGHSTCSRRPVCSPGALAEPVARGQLPQTSPRPMTDHQQGVTKMIAHHFAAADPATGAQQAVLDCDQYGARAACPVTAAGQGVLAMTGRVRIWDRPPGKSKRSCA